jgi:hypothetical protein
MSVYPIRVHDGMSCVFTCHYENGVAGPNKIFGPY